LAMDHHAATDYGNRVLTGRSSSPLSRSTVLRSRDGGTRTIGFPALQNERQKRVWFDPPRSAICKLDGGAQCADCLVLGVWDSGARLRIEDTSIPAEFDLLFASGPKPVRRRCKRLSVCGDVMDVEFKRTKPSYVLDTGQE
ncbi:MAG TPA: hypothetical protein VFT30_05950, partial [Nitrospira sp.]|nr:hypothetical protein [Nitrospira sp.]